MIEAKSGYLPSSLYGVSVYLHPQLVCQVFFFFSFLHVLCLCAALWVMTDFLLYQSAPPPSTVVSVSASIPNCCASQPTSFLSWFPARCASQPPSFATKDATPTVFLPVTPMPLVVDPSQRLQELKDGLNPHSSFSYFYEGQHPNIRAAIKAYEGCKMPLGSTTYFIGGKIVSKAEAAVTTTFVRGEVCSLFHHPTFLTCTDRNKTLACRVSACTEG